MLLREVQAVLMELLEYVVLYLVDITHYYVSIDDTILFVYNYFTYKNIKIFTHIFYQFLNKLKWILSMLTLHNLFIKRVT